MIEKLELHHLRTLVALCKSGNASAAAEVLGVSQQAVSLQLKRLREVLGDPLFVPTGRGLAPTAYARLLQPRVEEVLALLHAIPLAGALSLEDMERTLHIAATDHAQCVVLRQLLPALRQAAPRVRVMVSNIGTGGLVRRMQSGELALALTSNGYVPEGLLTQSLFTERYVCVASADMDLGAEPLALEDIARHDFLVVSPGVAGFEGSAGAWFEQQGVQRRVVLSVPGFLVAQEFLRASRMVAFLPSRLLPCVGLREVALRKEPPGYEVVAAYHAASATDPLLQWVLARMRADLAQSSAPGL